MKFSREKQPGRPSRQRQERKPLFQLADNRPEAVWQAKMMRMISERDSNLPRIVSESPAGKMPLQRKPWQSKLPTAVKQEEMFLSDKVDKYKAIVYINDIPDGVLPADRSHAVTEMAEAVATTPHIPEKDKFLSTKAIRSISPPGGPYQSGIGPADANKKNTYNNFIDPFYYKLSRKYAGGKKLNLYYQFAQASYGYIAKIKEDTGAAGDVDYAMNPKRGNKQFLNDQFAVPLGDDDSLFRQYPSAHDTLNAEKISDSAKKGFTDGEVGFVNPDPAGMDAGQVYVAKQNRQEALNKRSLRLDAITKLGGEGARFQCVRNHMEELTNNSIFYCLDGGQYKGITFQKLWGLWGDKFEYAFNIDNATVIMKAAGSMQVYQDADLVKGRDFDLDKNQAKQ